MVDATPLLENYPKHVLELSAVCPQSAKECKQNAAGIPREAHRTIAVDIESNQTDGQYSIGEGLTTALGYKTHQLDQTVKELKLHTYRFTRGICGSYLTFQERVVPCMYPGACLRYGHWFVLGSLSPLFFVLSVGYFFVTDYLPFGNASWGFLLLPVLMNLAALMAIIIACMGCNMQSKRLKSQQEDHNKVILRARAVVQNLKTNERIRTAAIIVGRQKYSFAQLLRQYDFHDLMVGDPIAVSMDDSSHNIQVFTGVVAVLDYANQHVTLNLQHPSQVVINFTVPKLRAACDIAQAITASAEIRKINVTTRWPMHAGSKVDSVSKHESFVHSSSNVEDGLS